MNVTPIILCGGSGTRLWPLSRAGFPKQFLVLSGEHSLFQQAVHRLQSLASEGIALSNPLVVCNDEHRFLALEQLRELRTEPAALLLEPEGRNTAPALTLAALQALEGGADPVLVVTPSDHMVTDVAAYSTAVRQAARMAAEGAIVVLGISPDRPETGYGYIHANSAEVLEFVEKPDVGTAQGYLDAGDYYWNSGMFVLRASNWMAALERFRPDIAAATKAAFALRNRDGYFVRPGKDEFAAVPSESVDYAVMERCPGSGLPMQMQPLTAGWSDLGAWDAVWQVADKDAEGNVAAGDTILLESRNTLVQATSRLVGVVGMDDVVVVETPDAVLVSKRGCSQDVKRIVDRLAAGRGPELSLHRKVHRPWGWYDSIDAGERFQVKRIMVKPGASLSLQMHHHRAEHWVVVRGTAEVTCGDNVMLLSENQSTYIPLGQTHRLRNPGKVALEIIEVQSGSYLGEDDIVRFKDTYGRG